MPKGFSFVKVAENEQYEPTFAVKDDVGLIVLIRDDAASVMMLFLPSDMSRSRAAFDRALRALRFAEPLP